MYYVVQSYYSPFNKIIFSRTLIKYHTSYSIDIKFGVFQLPKSWLIFSPGYLHYIVADNSLLFTIIVYNILISTSLTRYERLVWGVGAPAAALPDSGDDPGWACAWACECGGSPGPIKCAIGCLPVKRALKGWGWWRRASAGWCWK